MTNEDSVFDAGDLFDEGVKEAGIDPEEIVSDSATGDEADVITSKDDTDTKAEEPETKPETKPTAEDVAEAIESTKEADQQVDSIISELIPKPQEPDAAQTKPDFEPGKYVPVEDHIKLRARAQAAERETEELRQRLETSTTQTGGVKPGTEAEKSPLEQFVEDNPDEDIVPPKVQLEERKFHEARAQKAQQAKEQAEQSERENQEKQYRTNAAIKAIGTKAEQSEAEVRKTTPDYEAVVTPFVKANMLSEAERIEFLRDANPAKKLYDICKAKAEALRGVLGMPANTTTTPSAKKTATSKAPADKPADAANNEDDLTDDEIFEAVAGENFIKDS